MPRTAVVLFNLGGPDRPEAIQPFLKNLFSDPAIIRLPNPLRSLIANWASSKRAKEAREIYAKIGGRSPILEQTWDQARALQAVLSDDHRVFICMRYWHPMAEETVAQVAEFAPERVVLLPLYPQFSTTTSESSINAWYRAARTVGLEAETRSICCYPTEPGFVAAQAELVAETLAEAGDTPIRVLFSAHGLPEKVIDDGDPYRWQVEQTAAAIATKIGRPELDWQVCYQSRVGPLKWIGPSTDEEITRAGKESLGVVVVPLAFVSEHSETLVELDMEYRELAHQAGVRKYLRAPTVRARPAFIEGLASVIAGAFERGGDPASHTGARLCPANWRRCPCRQT